MSDFDCHDPMSVLQKLPNCGMITMPALDPGPYEAQKTAMSSEQRLINRNNEGQQGGWRLGSLWKAFAQWTLSNQIGLSFLLIALLSVAHLFPRAQPFTVKCLKLSHRNPQTGKYQNGVDDVYFMVFLIVLFSGLRAGTMKYVLQPFAESFGVRKAKDLTRFCEQSWLLCYYSVFWTMGMYIYYTSSYWLNLKELWTNWPDRELTGLMKFYILAQWAFWLQQVLVVHIEERRKDYWQMLLHHFVTIGLIHGCYVYHHTRVGNLILIIMDFVDIVLPSAKCLKYLGFTTLCDAMFGMLLVSWIFTRHIFYSMVCYSLYVDIPSIIGESCWKGPNDRLEGPLSTPEGFYYLLEPFLDPKGTVCFGHTLKWIFLSPLLVLQALNFVWLGMIVRVALRVLRRQGAEDSRSDDEGEKEEVRSRRNTVVHERAPIKERASQSWKSLTRPKRHGSASGISFSGHQDKVLKSRIGCKKDLE